MVNDMTKSKHTTELRLTPVSASKPTSEHAAGKPATLQNTVPKLPPRPQSSTDTYRSSSPIPPSLPARPSAAKTTDTIVRTSTLSRKPPPPIPTQSPSMQSISSLAASSPSKWSSPNTQFNKNARAASPSQSRLESPILTPASTGDYMLVTSPDSKSKTYRAAPPVPLRPVQNAPQPRASLDLNASPPDGLVLPVTPDSAMKKTASKGPPPPPPSAASKPRPKIDIEKDGKEEQASVVSPKKGGPPVIPKKPVALRSSAQGE